MEVPNTPKLTSIKVCPAIPPFLLDIILSDDTHIRPYAVNVKIDNVAWEHLTVLNLVQTETS